MSLFGDDPEDALGKISLSARTENRRDYYDPPGLVKRFKKASLPMSPAGCRWLPVFGMGIAIGIFTLLYAKEHVVWGLSQAGDYFTTSLVTSQAAALEKEIPHAGIDMAVNDPGPSQEVFAEDYLVWDDLASNDSFDKLPSMRPMPEMTLHYVWCGLRFFDFRNFLAVKSAIDAIQPKEVRFHYQDPPMVDSHGYYTWFDILRSMYSNIVMVKITGFVYCFSVYYNRYLLVLDILRRDGGIYAPEDAIFLKLMDRFRDKPFVSGVASCDLKYFQDGFIFAMKDGFQVPNSEKAKLQLLTNCHDPSEDVLRPCLPEERYRKLNVSGPPACLKLSSALYPRALWAATDKASSIAKLVAYGKTDLKPRSSAAAGNRVPRIAHYLCDQDCRFPFTTFISILSALYVGGLQRVLVHGPQLPSGPWWDRLQQNHSQLVHFLYRELKPTGTNLSVTTTNEMNLYIVRTEILLHFGGVFHDSHVIWTQRLPEYLLMYEAVVSPDWHTYGDWPESVNHALIIARGGALYLQKLLQMFREKASMVSPWIADHYLSYRIVELDPTLLYLYPHLQVKCLNHNCHPTWIAGYRSQYQLNTQGPTFDWRKDALSLHWEDAFSQLDVHMLQYGSGLIVEAARHVLQSAGIDVRTL